MADVRGHRHQRRAHRPVEAGRGVFGWEATPALTVTSTGSAPRSTRCSAPTWSSAACARWQRRTAGSSSTIVPGHTGKGPDFRLAEMGVGDYPGIYHMVEIPPRTGSRPRCRRQGFGQPRQRGRGAAAGRLHRRPAATGDLPGPGDQGHQLERHRAGHRPRWGPAALGLHYFKDGQPSINWLDPTFAGMRLVIGDALHALGDLGAAALRLDANGFLGVEKSAERARRLGRRASTVGGREPADRQHGPKSGWVHVSGAEPVL